MLPKGRKNVHFPQELLVSLAGLLGLVDAAIHHFQVGHDQLQVDDANVPNGVGAAFYMDDVFIIKAAHHMNDRFGAADIGQELVAQPLTMTGALDQTGDVHEFDHSRSGLFGMVQIAQPVQAGVWHSHRAYVRLDGAEGIVGALCACIGNGVKQGALANIGQTHNT